MGVVDLFSLNFLILVTTSASWTVGGGEGGKEDRQGGVRVQEGKGFDI